MPSRKQSSDKKIQELKKKNSSSSKSTNTPLGPNPFSQVDISKTLDKSTPSTDTPLHQENEELKQKNLRLMADMQNIMRQHDMDVSQAKKSTKKEISLSFIDFVSSMNLAFSFAPKDPDPSTENFLNSLKSSLQSSLQKLKSYNIEVILPEIDTDFDPATMNAISEPAEATDHPKIKGVVSAGLKIEGQVVKPVTVTL